MFVHLIVGCRTLIAGVLHDSSLNGDDVVVYVAHFTNCDVRISQLCSLFGRMAHRFWLYSGFFMCVYAGAVPCLNFFKNK